MWSTVTGSAHETRRKLIVFLDSAVAGVRVSMSLPDTFGRRGAPPYGGSGGLRGYDRDRGPPPPRDYPPPYGGRDYPPPRYFDRRDSFGDDRGGPPPPYRGRSRSRSWSRSPPPRRDGRVSPRRRDDRSPPRGRDSWDGRGPPPYRRDSVDGAREYDRGRGPPPNVRAGGGPSGPGEREHPPPDDPNDWKLHLAEQLDDEQDTQKATRVLKLGGCMMRVPEPPAMPFWRAVEYGDVARVAALLEAGEPVDQPGGPYGSTALGWAAVSGHVELAQLCLRHGAKPDAKARKGSTPLHMATWNGDHDEIARLLLQADADPSIPNAAGLTALAQARWFHRLEMTSTASSRYEMDEWRAQWGKSAAGRAKLIARLEAATPSQVSREEAGAETGASSGEAAGVAVRAEDASAASNGAAAPRVKDEARTKADDDDEEDMGADEV